MNYAAKEGSIFLTNRIYGESAEKDFPRKPFQRDRDRILHSRSFRRMMHKTQVFNANLGDHYRNRLTHTLEVSQIARSIGKALGLNDELIEAIALGHDLGHTPYGHVGERTLDNILRGRAIPEIKDQGDGFKHNLQSLRIVDELESRCLEYNGINLTLAVREGIIKHTKTMKNGILCQDSNNNYTNMNLNNPFSFTLEGQVVAIADEIAQYTHDLEDSVRSNIITIDDVIKFPIIKKVLRKNRGINAKNYKTQFPNDPTFYLRMIIIRDYIGYLINDVIRTSTPKIEEYFKQYSPKFSNVHDCINESCVNMSPEVEKKAKEVYDEITNKVIFSESISIADSKSEYVIKQLFKAFYKHPKQLPDYILSRYFTRKGLELNRLKIIDDELRSDSRFIRSICDHISGMTDQFAAREYRRLYMPE
ncbi:MAG: dNTP triphosphohydrolase [Lachnoclostridium sp.]|nr:dNTP triphosphohydrolase [Lachnospira sp.]MCM1249076.1 dNTP triphosphohydrolase [Lachnoclostridium sp.]